MRHVVLFLYFLFLSSGFAGIIFIYIIYKRIGLAFLGRIAAVLSVFTAWLLITIVLYYLDSIVQIPVASILGPINFLLGTAAYILLFAAMISSPAPKKPVEMVAALSPVAIYYLLLLLSSTVFPRLQRFAQTHPLPFIMLSVASGSVLVGYIGTGFIRGARQVRQETGAFILRWYGIALLVFAAAILGNSLLLAVWDILIQSVVLWEFLLFFLLNIISVIAFVRYIVRPSAFIEDGKISEGFIRAFGISAREAEVIEMISRGMSNKEIADKMHVSFATVRTHVYNIFKKSGVASRVELLRIVSGYRQ